MEKQWQIETRVFCFCFISTNRRSTGCAAATATSLGLREQSGCQENKNKLNLSFFFKRGKIKSNQMKPVCDVIWPATGRVSRRHPPAQFVRNFFYFLTFLYILHLSSIMYSIIGCHIRPTWTSLFYLMLRILISFLLLLGACFFFNFAVCC